MNYPLILVVGTSGTGKSYSLKNLPPEKTLVLNIERKPLPFKHAFSFGKNMLEISTVPDFEDQLRKGLGRQDIDTIVIESGTKFFEELLSHSKSLNKGYDIYNFFNDRVARFLSTIKSNDGKIVIVLGIDEIVKEVTVDGGELASRRMSIVGKQWEGKVEKEFTIVLFTSVKQEKGKPASYQFMTNTNGSNSAKSPPDLFGKDGQYIENDMNFVVNKVLAYYGLEKKTTDKLLSENNIGDLTKV